MGESFRRWAARVTREGIYDLSSVIEFVTEEKRFRKETGKNVATNWWSKVTPRPKGKGRVPVSMKNSRTNEWFTFPMFEIKRLPGQLVEAKLVFLLLFDQRRCRLLRRS